MGAEARKRRVWGGSRSSEAGVWGRACAPKKLIDIIDKIRKFTKTMDKTTGAVPLKKIVIKIKKKLLHDEYIITNRRVIYKFKYLVLNFDHQETNETGSFGLVNIPPDRLKELLVEQDISFNSNENDKYLEKVKDDLKDWHPLVTKVDIDFVNIHTFHNLSDYGMTWENYKEFITLNKYGTSLHDHESFKILEQQPNLYAVDVRVHFKLRKIIKTIDELGINPKYLRKLLSQYLLKHMSENPIYLDEVSVDRADLPLASGDTLDDTVQVYPYMWLTPLMFD